MKFTVLQHSILKNQYAALLYIEPWFRDSFTMTSYIRPYAEKYVFFLPFYTLFFPIVQVLLMAAQNS